MGAERQEPNAPYETLWQTVALGITLVLLGAPAASAHDHLVSGDYRLTIGWADEPAFVGFKNAVSVAITDKRERSGPASPPRAPGSSPDWQRLPRGLRSSHRLLL